jgi:hypothetical protein
VGSGISRSGESLEIGVRVWFGDATKDDEEGLGVESSDSFSGARKSDMKGQSMNSATTPGHSLL